MKWIIRTVGALVVFACGALWAIDRENQLRARHARHRLQLWTQYGRGVDIVHSPLVRRSYGECPWCHCIGFHSEMCEGFSVNDPAARVR